MAGERRADESIDCSPGDDVIVRDAMGRWLEKRALSEPIAGGDFAVVWATWRDAPDTEQGLPWPYEDVRWPDAFVAFTHEEFDDGR